ncbi:hypothetical protein RLEG12_07925 (plasmid) [Rhizobium leguminosarum bv. trifolii CB782]|nr:hypothetical protein RLEG12_07925 [Rhizobium leguminosarum bv. trifolii CB782]
MAGEIILTIEDEVRTAADLQDAVATAGCGICGIADSVRARAAARTLLHNCLLDLASNALEPIFRSLWARYLNRPFNFGDDLTYARAVGKIGRGVVPSGMRLLVERGGGATLSIDATKSGSG